MQLLKSRLCILCLVVHKIKKQCRRHTRTHSFIRQLFDLISLLVVVVADLACALYCVRNLIKWKHIFVYDKRLHLRQPQNISLPTIENFPFKSLFPLKLFLFIFRNLINVSECKRTHFDKNMLIFIFHWHANWLTINYMLTKRRPNRTKFLHKNLCFTKCIAFQLRIHEFIILNIKSFWLIFDSVLLRIGCHLTIFRFRHRSKRGSTVTVCYKQYKCTIKVVNIFGIKSMSSTCNVIYEFEAPQHNLALLFNIRMNLYGDCITVIDGVKF